MPSSSIHPLPVNPTTGQQPLASLGGVRVSSTSGNVASGSVGGVSRDTLKGLQDVVWSDDEDDPDCLLCAEPLDLSDLNFKPCQCGMQICQFCYNKLLGSDARCPGCRRPYDAKAVVFQPVDWDEVKRAKEKKTRRAKTIKQLTSMGRRHLLNVRIVMKNTVYVVGMKLPAPGDESIPILRSGDYFGQYGKISRIYLRDRTTLSSTAVHTLTPDDPSTSTGIYIVYVRREDAARAISALDGIAAPQGPPGRTLKATYATCRYCDAFLKGQKCDNPSCQNLHEWGGDSDCFTKDDMEIALTRPAEYDARQQEARARASSLSKTAPISKPATLEDVIGASGLPNSAGWAKGAVARPVANGKMTAAAPIGSSRPVKTPSVALSLNNNAAFPLPTPSPVNPAPKDKRSKASSTKMARGKSSDSTQSGNTSSAHTSPKRKNLPLAPTALTNQITPIPLPNSKAGPPPGLLRPALDTQGDSQLPDDLQDGSVSAESEAGPSSSSPAPQTPSRLTDGPPLPPPLTSDPICIHSPYEEPRMFPFPASDPAFEFVLSIDEETQRQAQEFDYTPSAFGKTLFGLAQLGILAPDVLDPSPPPRTEINGVSGLFSPFDASSEVIPEALAGPSNSHSEEPAEGKRTTSRFDFARPSSRPSISRDQSPFALRMGTDDRPGEASMWGKGSLSSVGESHRPHHGLGPQMTGTSNAPSSGYGGFGDPDGAWGSGPGSGRGGANLAFDPRWQGPSQQQQHHHHHQQQQQPQQHAQGRSHREHEFSNGMLPNLGIARKFDSNVQEQQPQGHQHFAQSVEDAYLTHGRRQMASTNHHGQPSAQSPVHAFGGNHTHERMMQQQQQTQGQYSQRAQSPTPLGHGYRRY